MDEQASTLLVPPFQCCGRSAPPLWRIEGQRRRDDIPEDGCRRERSRSFDERTFSTFQKEVARVSYDIVAIQVQTVSGPRWLELGWFRTHGFHGDAEVLGLKEGEEGTRERESRGEYRRFMVGFQSIEGYSNRQE